MLEAGKDGDRIMIRLTAHYDGKVLIPDEPVTLPAGVPLEVTVQASEHLPANGDPILAFVGLGAEAWAGVEPVQYQRKEREGWE